MIDFTATHFRFEVEALTPIGFDDYTGSALRGGLVDALQHNFCPARSQADATHQAICPVCWLLSYEATPGDSRRPYAIEPVVHSLAGKPSTARLRFDPGERFQFGLTLFGQAVNLFPYLVLAAPQMGNAGIGQKLDDGHGRWRRGQFVLRRIEEVNPLAGQRTTLMGEGEQMIQTPKHPVTQEQVEAATHRLAAHLASHNGELGVRFLTPTRIVQDKRLVHEPHFRPLFQRLMERVNELQRTFGGGSQAPAWNDLLALADQVALIDDGARWWDVQGRSSRLGREQQLGGYIGSARYAAPPEVWRPLLPWLLWGMSTHVGKNAVKGSGWYTLQVRA